MHEFRQAQATSTIRRRIDAITIAVFLLALCAPHIDAFVRTDEARGTKDTELRSPAPRSSLTLDLPSLSAFPASYEAYWNDSFGLRDYLLRWHALEKLFVFDVSPTSKVVLGKDDWMFYTYDSSIEIYRGLLPFTEPQLETWRTMLESRRDYCAQRGIAYVFAIAPNKESVYPDYMPARFNRLGPTRLDQLMAYMHAHSDFEILDLRRALSDERRNDTREERVFFPLGTHWNGRGAWAGYRAILEALAPRFPVLQPFAVADLERERVPGNGDSWGRNMYVYDVLPQSEFEYRRPAAQRKHSVLEQRWKWIGDGRTEVADARLPTAMLFHDSFGPYVTPLLAEHFSRLTCIWRPDFDPSAIDIEKPDVVIEMFVERALVNWKPRNVPPERVIDAAAAFNESNDIRLKLDVAKDPPECEGVGDVHLEATHDDSGPALAIDMANSDAKLLLPPIDRRSEAGLVVFVDLTSPFATRLDLWYRRAESTEFKRRDHVQVPLSEGRNQVYFRLRTPAIEGRLMLRPGLGAGRRVLHAFEVRG